MSGEDPPLFVDENIVISKRSDFTGQRLTCVTPLLSAMACVTFWDKTCVLSRNLSRLILDKEAPPM